MSKFELHSELKGKYKMCKGFYPGVYEVPGFGIIDFRRATPAKVEQLIAHFDKHPKLDPLVQKVPNKSKTKAN